MNETLQTIHQRRAVRKFKPLPVEKEMILQVIEAGRMAPSAMNKQPWSFYILTEPEDIRSFSSQIAKAALKDIAGKGIKSIAKMIVELVRAPVGFVHLKESDFVFHGAPVVIFLTAPKENEWAALDIGMCCQNMMLAAKSIGLDTCPVGVGKYVEHTKSYPTLRITPEEHVLMAVVLGYGEDQPHVHERRKGNVFFISSRS
jgi:nitroreductase